MCILLCCLSDGMDEANQPHPPGLRAGVRCYKPLLIAGFLTGTIVITCVWLGSRQARNSRIQPSKTQVTLFEFTPASKPRAVLANATWLPDDAIVIGVVVGTTARAYAVNEFNLIEEHDINDSLAGKALSVVHCPRTGCTRVYTDPNQGKPLPIAVGGWVIPGWSPRPKV